MAALEFALRVLAHYFVDEEILSDDHVAFHPHHFGNVGYPTRAIPQAGGLNDDSTDAVIISLIVRDGSE